MKFEPLTVDTPRGPVTVHFDDTSFEWRLSGAVDAASSAHRLSLPDLHDWLAEQLESEEAVKRVLDVYDPTYFGDLLRPSTFASQQMGGRKNPTWEGRLAREQATGQRAL